MTPSRGWALTLECVDPGRMTRFWSLALGYKVAQPPDGFDDWASYLRAIGVPARDLQPPSRANVYLVDPAGVYPGLSFQQVADGKKVRNRLHLDIHVGGDRRRLPLGVRRERIDAEVERLVAAGGTRLRYDQWRDHYHVVMQDPEGNEFCVC
ncbi:MAG TPA: VOC family protein [Candidatus Dormibacteraeota bacterium]|nr:VOC family protein [Candidatus Dormibacteraeota bacterium]